MVGERDPLTQEVIGAAIEVHREIGPGLLESVYQKCLERELAMRSPAFQAQARLPLIDKGAQLDDTFVIDVFFPGRLAVEIKAAQQLPPVHDAQLLTYLRLSKTRVGPLINFHIPVLKDGIKRLVL
jgi:GxxExxY protein